MTIRSGDCLSRTYRLSSKQVQRYRRDGHVFLPQLLPRDSITPYREAIVATADRHSREMRPLEDRDTYGKAFLQIFNLWTLDETVRRFVQAPCFAEVAARLLGVERVRLYHDQALFKEAGGGITPWHQDQYYWPLDTEHTITLWMPLVDIEENMGMMQFASRAHRLGYITNKGISDDSEAFYERFVTDKGLDISEVRTARAGDASFHAGWALHRAPPNQSRVRREVMTVIYFADGARITDPVRPEARGDLRAWLGDLPPGAPAATILNPIVWTGPPTI
ncbi:MAG: phytanoyl-CoA dioxygenase family protein [Gammaproteobacteria bacterium]|nr:phytanoyl-CoA dioxygenase family protein [Gammaproteobacteria bacterium]MYF29604.1 phytanoyl-CoA dioxygenase family protein [Gammaproteobacteria bacterium]MYK48200.1 phytanoyl-CoA dioxygenase family protein [Gammaproteobacteria bacterium]